jgi:RNA polymerase sigma-70 factor (ECF subfamily)
LTDRQLLERFVARREQAAFEALVQRHGPAVLGICRRELACEQDAEDVFQATFLVLARRAALIPWRESIGHWLQAVARRLALRARCSAGRLRKCASVGGAGRWPEDCPEPADPLPGPLAEAARRELNLLIAEELGGLPEQYRAPVVLCYLQGKTNEQAAYELGWPTGSMSRRLSRARALLRERLTRRGLGFVALGCLMVACLWMLASPSPRQRSNVAMAMAAFRAEGGDEGIERLLQKATDEPRLNAEDRQRLERVARQAAHAADVTAGHDPGRRRDDWRRLSEEMRTSAGELSESLAQDDHHKTQKAARRLAVTCQGCHASFRH